MRLTKMKVNGDEVKRRQAGLRTTISISRELRSVLLLMLLLMLLMLLLATIEHVEKALKLGQNSVYLEEADES